MIGENLKAMLDKLPAEKRAKAEAALTEVDELATEIESGYLRQADYTKKTQELAARKQTLEANWETANAEYQRMLAHDAEVQESLTATQAEKDAVAQKLKEAEDKLKAAPAIDASKFLTPEQFEAQRRKDAAAQTAYFGRTLKIIRDHQKLFPNEDLDPEQLIQESMAANKTPDAYWEEKFKVAEKRKEIAAAEKAKELEAATNAGYQKRISEEANPATRALKPSENPFYTPADEKQTSEWDISTPTKADTDMKEALERAYGAR